MNKTFKKFLAILTTLTMAMSLFAVVPAMAEEGEAPQLTAMQQLWYETNLVTNGNVEQGEITDEDAAIDTTKNLTGNWAIHQNHSKVDMVVQTSTNQAYSEGQSILVKKNGGAEWGILFPYVYSSALKPNTAYIANYKILGTQKNADYTGTNNVSSFLMKYNGSSATYMWSGYTAHNSYAVSELTAAPASDAESQGEPMGKENWKDMTLTFTSAETLPSYYGFGIKFLDAGVEFYTDDYYLGELMVAEVQNTTAESTVAIPETGNATLALSSKAVNQLGTEAGLDGTTYSYKLLYPVKGVTVNNNVLTISSEAEAQTIQVKVVANPVFAGAEAQSAEVKERRTTVIDITLTNDSVAATDIYEELRNSTNMYKKNWGLESGQVYNLEGEGAETKFAKSSSTDVLSAERSSNQAYSGDYSLLIKSSQSTGSYYILRDGAGNWDKGKTYVSSVMVLGTEANNALIEAEKNYAEQYKSKLTSYTAGQVNGSNPLSNVGNKGAVSLKNISIAPASTSETPNSPKVGKEQWGMVYSCVEYGTEGSTWDLGAGVYLSQGHTTSSAEYYADDFYWGELVVANVDVQADKNKVAVPESGNATVTLTASAYNQLGNTEYLALDENTPYTYTIESAPAGVTVDNAGVITVPAGTEAGKINVKVIANPTFLGAADQTAAQKALREKVVTIDVVAAKGFNFSVADGMVTAQAFVDKALENDAKAYCALYKLLDGGAKKLMAVNSATLQAGDTEVELDEIEIPITYDYEIKCFMWYENNPMKNVIPAVIWE